MAITFSEIRCKGTKKIRYMQMFLQKNDIMLKIGSFFVFLYARLAD